MSVYYTAFPDLTHGTGPDRYGTYVREIDIPVEEESLGYGLFFMDVNFDGEEELLMQYPGYNTIYFACFDLVNDSYNRVCPGLLQSINEEPYNSFVLDNTEFDYEKKTIHIFEPSGCCSHTEIWAKMVQDDFFHTNKLQVVKKEKVEYFNDYEIKEIYERVNGELVKVATKKMKL